MSKPLPNRLLVEGLDDRLVIPQLMEYFIPWGDRNEREKWPAEIISYGGVELLLKPGAIEAELKTPGLRALGVMVDADTQPDDRWHRIRSRAKSTFPAIPTDLPVDGLVIENETGLRFGVWLMPDNRAHGMLETFLGFLVPTTSDRLLGHAKKFCVDGIEKYQAPLKQVHLDKALIHSWLAVQDPPGQQMHSALIQNILKRDTPETRRFVSWFRALFSV